MNATFEAIYGLTGQVVELYPPEWAEGAAPSSASAKVYAGDASLDDAAEFSPTVTVDSVSTTVATSAAGYSQTTRNTLTVASATGITTERQYRIANAAGQCELVTVVGISGTTVTLEDDLGYDYAVGATFRGVRMYFTIDATWVATESEILLPSAPSYKVVWAYTIAEARKHYTYLRLVRQRAKHGVTPTDLLRRRPDLADDQVRSRRGKQFRYAVEDAFARFRFDVRAEGYEPSQVRDAELVDHIVLAKALELVTRAGAGIPGRDSEALIASYARDYDTLFGKALTSLHVALDMSTEGAATVRPVQRPLFSR